MQRILDRIRNLLLRPLEILSKKKHYERDPIYQENLRNLARCFEDREDASAGDDALLKRIASSYQEAARDLNHHPEVFRPSNEWLPIYKHNLREIIKALEESDLAALNGMYRNFWRDPCSAGLVGLPVDMKKSFFNKSGKIGYIDRIYYLNDSIHRFNLWKKLLGQRYPIEALVSPPIGNPYGYFVGNTFIKAGADYQHFYATRINDLLADVPGRKVVVEIGGGFGAMAYYLMRDSTDATYVDFDLPENLALTSFYLMKAFPEKKVLLYGEADFSQIDLSDYDIVLMPSFQLDKLKDGTANMVFNSYSLAEMSPQTIRHYVLQSAKLITDGGWLYHVNHTRHSLVSAKGFPVPDSLSLVSEEFAAWNLGRNSDMDEYEFLYKKNKHVQR